MLKQEAGADARDEPILKCEKGAPTTPASSITVQQDITVEREFPREYSRAPLPTQSSHASIPEAWRPCAPERSHSRLNAQSSPELEIPLTDVLKELRIVQLECQQLRAQVESVAPTKVAWMREIGFTEITSRQDALTAQMDWIEIQFNTIAQDQNNAAESNQALWNNVGQCADQVRQMQGRLRDMSSDESDREIERQFLEGRAFLKFRFSFYLSVRFVF